MSSAGLSYSTLARRGEVDEMKHCATTKGTHLGPMRETFARIPCKNKNYTGAIFMQSAGSTLYLR